jgi:hypothetical protein
VARVQARPRRPRRKSPSLDENDQLRLSPADRADLDTLRQEADGDPEVLGI